jgi:hypothetical protein
MGIQVVSFWVITSFSVRIRTFQRSILPPSSGWSEWGLEVDIDAGSIVRRPFEKFVDSSYHSESELCGGAVIVSFSKHVLWQVLHFLQRSTQFSKTCCRPFSASFRRIVEQSVLTSWSLRVRSFVFVVSLHRLHRLVGRVLGFVIQFSQAEHTILSRNAPLSVYQLLRHSEKGSFKATVTEALTTIKRDEDHATTTLLPPLQLVITVTVSLCITAAHCRQSTNFSNGPRTKVEYSSS